jgi:hypothetical protein
MLIKDLVAMIDTYHSLKDRMDSLIIKQNLYAPNSPPDKGEEIEIVREINSKVANSVVEPKSNIVLSDSAIIATAVDKTSWDIDQGLTPSDIRDKKENIKTLIQELKQQIDALDTDLLTKQ